MAYRWPALVAKSSVHRLLRRALCRRGHRGRDHRTKQGLSVLHLRATPLAGHRALPGAGRGLCQV